MDQGVDLLWSSECTFKILIFETPKTSSFSSYIPRQQQWMNLFPHDLSLVSVTPHSGAGRRGERLTPSIPNPISSNNFSIPSPPITNDNNLKTHLNTSGNQITHRKPPTLRCLIRNHSIQPSQFHYPYSQYEQNSSSEPERFPRMSSILSRRLRMKDRSSPRDEHGSGSC